MPAAPRLARPIDRSRAPAAASHPGFRRSSRIGRIGIAIAVTMVLVSSVPAMGAAPPLAATPHAPAAPSTDGALAAAEAALVAGGGPAAARPWACHGLRTIGTVACGALARPSAGNVTGWTDAGPSPPPQDYDQFYLVDDASDGYVLLFGTTSGYPDLWSYTDGTWTARALPSPSPVPCPGSEIAYDSADGYVLFLGGSNFPYGAACPSANETWTYHGGIWTQLHPTTSPSGLVFASMSDDPADGYVVMFGGEAATACPRSGYCGTTWEFHAGNWTTLSPTTSPSARAEAGIAYDAFDGYVVLFGGLDENGSMNDTWEFAAGDWTRLHPVASPPVPQPDAFSYDGADHAVVYTTADNYSSGANPEITWTYSGGNWTDVTNATVPPGRLDGQMANDPGDGVPIFFGGLGGAFGLQSLADSWTLHAGKWTNVTPPAPTPRDGAAVAYDPATQATVLFGGATSSYGASANDTWSYANGSWKQLITSRAPSLYPDPGMCWDAADGYLLLVGQAYPNSTTETWEFAGGSWSQVTPALEPPAGSQETVVYDAADGYVLDLTGSLGAAQTWTYHAGVWTNRTATAGPAPPESSNGLVYDSSDAKVVLFGGLYEPVSNGPLVQHAYTFTFFGGSWHNATVANATAPPPLYAAAVSDDPGDGGVLFWGGTSGIGGPVNNGSWRFANGSWSELGAPVHPSPRTFMTGAYDPALQQAVFFGGGNAGSSVTCGSGTSLCGDTWLWGSHVSPLPLIESFVATPDPIDLGGTVNLTVVAGGGTGALTYSYLDLPSGCASANRSAINCTPIFQGSWGVQVHVVDAVGEAASASTTITVRSDATITSFVAVPASVPIGATTTLETTVIGGTGNYTYSYLGLPPGCPGQDVPALPCAPATAGNYSITVAVSDGAGAGAARATSVTVSAVGTPGAPSISSFAATPSAIVLGNSTNLSVVASGASPLTYAFTGLPAGCTSGNASTFGCTPTAAGTFGLRVTVSDVHHNTTTVATNLTVYPVGGGAGLAVSAFGAEPGTIMVNTTTFLQVVASGGHGPLSYAYQGLPPGCASINTSTLPCAPTRTGAFGVSVLVSDATGDRAGVRAVIEVIASGAALPEVSAFVATPSRVVVNASLTLFVAVGGGTLPFRYAFTGLPPGCASVDGPVLVCYPSMAGNYTVSVSVTDAAGHPAQASTGVEVVASPGPPVPGRSTSASAAATWLGPWADAGAAIAGAAVIAAIAATWDRHRRRRAGTDLVAQLDADGASAPAPPP